MPFPWKAVIGIGAGIFGQSAKRKAARRQNKAQAEANARRFAYDTDRWYMNRDRSIMERQDQVRAINVQRLNEAQNAWHTDVRNFRDWDYKLRIQDYERNAQNELFKKSESIYNQQIGFNRREKLESLANNRFNASRQISRNNALYDITNKRNNIETALALDESEQSAYIAISSQMRALEEERKKYAFAGEEAIIKSMNAKVAGRTRGGGRSIAKQGITAEAALGREQAMMIQALISADENGRSEIENVISQWSANDKKLLMQHRIAAEDAARQRTWSNQDINQQLKESTQGIMRKFAQANAQAHANRMLPPIDRPMIPPPLMTPLSNYKYPRSLHEFDFGPKPIRAQDPTYVPSWAGVFSNRDFVSGLGGLAENVFSGGGLSGTIGNSSSGGGSTRYDNYNSSGNQGARGPAPVISGPPGITGGAWNPYSR